MILNYQIYPMPPLQYQLICRNTFDQLLMKKQDFFTFIVIAYIAHSQSIPSIALVPSMAQCTLAAIVLNRSVVNMTSLHDSSLVLTKLNDLITASRMAYCHLSREGS